MLVRTIVAAAAVLASVGAFGRDWPTVELEVGTYVSSFGSDVRIDANADTRGSDIDLEDVLNLDDSLTDVRVDLGWRFRPRHRLELTYYDISRSGDRVQDREIVIGDAVFAVGTDVDTELGFDVFKAVYAWSFRQTEDFDASLSIGVHGMDIRLDAVGTIVDRPVDRQTSDRRFPLPVLGLNASKRLGGRWTLNAGADLFALDFDEVEGHLADARVTMDLAVTENLAFSFGFNWVDIDFDSDSEKFLGTLDYRYWAGTAAVKLMF